MFRRITAQTQLVVLGGLRRRTLLGLFLFSLGAILAGLLFVQFIPRDIGRAAGDFLFSVVWVSGFFFLLFYTVPAAAWGEERSFLPVYLARPISRSEYVLGLFAGMALLLAFLHLLLGLANWGILYVVRRGVEESAFPVLSLPWFLLAACGLYLIHLQLLAVILLFTSGVRGSFPILLCTICYYFICTGLPVVRESLIGPGAGGAGQTSIYPLLLQGLNALFPDASWLDFKTLVVSTDPAPAALNVGLTFTLALLYILVVMGGACLIYERRDLQ
ncbi:MAG: hypothetical protein Q4G66_07340 [bacterium]|nr:hypothetical protein [bacterium]